jgi:murein DD-endopeptidase MepM/ murein hydrolase activator NlpD
VAGRLASGALLVGACLALCAADAGQKAAGGAWKLEDFERGIREQLEKLHWSPASIDLDGLLAEIDRRLEAGEKPAEIDAWVRAHTFARWYRFAPVRPAVKGPGLYQLPFDRRVHWLVSQGIATENSHGPANEFAIDFAMPEGTPVLAARRGTVARVVDGFTACCLPRERSAEVNQVVVLHADGTFASYVHLRPKIPVQEGQSVQAGDLLGQSGSTGFSQIPHLHFEVSIRSTEERTRSIPVRFRNGAGGYLPSAWKLYENRPVAGVRLHVSIDGRELVSGKPFELTSRAPLQLRVERVGAAGGAIDVTRDPGTSYVALTPWSVSIDRAGRVAFDPPADAWSAIPEPIRRQTAIATVVFRGDDGEGYFDVNLSFAGAPATGKP